MYEVVLTVIYVLDKVTYITERVIPDGKCYEAAYAAMQFIIDSGMDNAIATCTLSVGV